MKPQAIQQVFAMICYFSSLTAQGGLISQQAYLKASNSGVADRFGWNVAISGDTAVVGAILESSNATGVNGNQSNNLASYSGAAYVYVRQGSNWTQQAYLKASNTDSQDYFGWSVAISGDTIVIGTPIEESKATGINGDQADNSRAFIGAVYVFVRTGTNWSQQAYLKPSNATTNVGGNFGHVVAVSGNTIVVGAPTEASNAIGVNGNQTNTAGSGSGAAYVFLRIGTTWSQQAYLKASNTGFNDNFGSAVALSGDTIIVGAKGESSNATGVNGNQSNNLAGSSGAAYVFVRTGTNWSQQAYLKASNAEFGDEFGNVGSIAVSGDTAVIGAVHEDSSATGVNGNQADNNSFNAGAAYVFVRSGTNWSQQAYLKASNTRPDHQFGRVGISGDTLVVSGYNDDSGAAGVNGDQNDQSSTNAGAAYVFVRTGTNWTQQAYLKASNPDPNDFFGFAVSISGDTVIVGAVFERSNATGVNGNQANNSNSECGAAYVFTGFGPPTQLTIVRDGSGGYFVRFNGIPGFTYRLQRTLSVTGPWSTIASNTAPAFNFIEYHDANPSANEAFYRTVQP